MLTEGHPRPQLARTTWIDLCGTWQFSYDDSDVGVEQGWSNRDDVFDRTICVPFPPESPASGIGDRGPHAVVWYRRELPSSRPGDGRLLLHFGAVDYRAQVWVNGFQVASHEGGHTPFSADITAALRDDGAADVLVVRAEDRADDLTQPRGKQYWGDPPQDVWYHRTTGIWQPVWLEPVGRAHVTELRWTPDLDRETVSVDVSVSDAQRRPLSVTVRLTLHGRVLADDSYRLTADTLSRDIEIFPGVPSVQRRLEVLWSPRWPNLVEAQVTVRDGDEVLDEVHSYFGLRTVGAAGGRFTLNGNPYYSRLVLHQGYWPETHLAAPSDEALRAEVEAVKALGFNGVRVHQKIEDPRFLYWCDRLGLLVWGEMPSAYRYTPTALRRFTTEWLEVLARDYNHPCIVMWVPFNESWGVPGLVTQRPQQEYVKSVYHLTRAADPTRPVIGNDGWEHVRSDIWGIHDYALDGQVLRDRYGTPEAVERTIRDVQPGYRWLSVPEHHRAGEPVMITECGGIGFAPDDGQPWFGYGTVPDEEAFLAKYADLLTALQDCPTVSGFCYTQLTDVEHETNGLLFADRRPKVDPAAIAAITARHSVAVPADAVMANAMSAAETMGRAIADRAGS